MSKEDIAIYNEVGKMLKSLNRIVSKLAILEKQREEYLAIISKLAQEVNDAHPYSYSEEQLALDPSHDSPSNSEVENATP
jgi:predicted DNA-binding protein YlxM (UPF0122 family)